jgi:LCP family protein required for cell wall assembly
VFVAICLLAVSSLYAYVSYRFGQIHRVTIAGLSIGAAPGPTHSTSTPAGPPMNILVVGSDTRAALSDGAQFGGASVAGARSDTIMVVHLDPAAGTASLLSIPRDLWVPVQGYGETRINTAFNNGPDLLVRTIQDDLGIPINHYVDVDFDSFRQVVNALGGVKFWFPEPVRDNDNGVNDSGLDVTTPGCYTLTGDLALSLVRTRHMQYEDNGQWIFEAESDLARIRRQQLFIKKIVGRAQSLGLTSLTRINGVVGGVVSNLTVDSGFSESEMISLARRYRNLNPSTLPTATLPTTATVIGGADVLLLEKQPAQEVIDLWQGIEPPSSQTTPGVASGAATPVGVAVSNGSGITHQAAQAAAALVQAGYQADVAGSASSYDHQESVIDYAPSDLAAAQALQARLVGGAVVQEDSGRTAGTLGLITGSSYGGIQAATAAPTTTAAPTPPASLSAALAAVPGNTSAAPAFPGPHRQDPPPPGSGC